jgi:hypothetical protein
VLQTDGIITSWQDASGLPEVFLLMGG